MHIIGIDHGNAAMKTSHFSFPSGIAEYEFAPYTTKNLLEYEGRYYVCGTGRQPLLKDKTTTDRYYLLTLAALAKELDIREIPSPADVYIAAGLPLTNYGRDLDKFRSYLLRKNPVCFRFEKKDYEVNIRNVFLYPQAVAGLSLHMDMLEGEPSVIAADIGGWTVDLMRIDYGVPDALTCRSLELGMIRCIDEISEQVRRSAGMSVTGAQIETILRGEKCSIDDKVKRIIEKEGKRYAARLFSSISECGFDVSAMPIIFMGGGAALIKRHIAPCFALCRPIILEDCRINAKGYERTCEGVAEGFCHA